MTDNRLTDHDNMDLIERWKTEFYREDQDMKLQKEKDKLKAAS